MFLLTLIIIFITHLPSLIVAQSNTSLTIPFATNSCPSNQFFDTSNLNCTSCPLVSYGEETCMWIALGPFPDRLCLDIEIMIWQGFTPTTNKLACQQCDPTSGAFYDTVDGFGTLMNWSTSVGTAPSCSCVGASTSQTISALVLNQGGYNQRCVTCPPNFVVRHFQAQNAAALREENDACMPLVS